MRIILLLILLSYSIISLAQTPNNFTINGVIEKGFAYKIHLRYKQDTETALGVDVNKTSDVINGKFSFKGSITRPVQAYLVLDGHSTYAHFYLDTGNITITASADREDKFTEVVNTIEIISVKGSASDSLQRDLSKKFRQLYESDQDDSVIIKNNYDLVLQFVKSHPDHNLSSELLQENYQFSYQQAKSIYDLLSSEQQQQSHRNGVDTELKRAQQLDKSYPFIALPDTAGNLVSGMSEKMKYLLLSFTRSQCDYCEKRNIELLDLYKQYSKKGFEILGVSLEFEFTKPGWIHDVHRLKLPWPQVNELEENKIASYFKVPHLPFIILVDKTGKILSVNPGKERLKKQLEKLLSP
jgi:hypothetical protein